MSEVKWTKEQMDVISSREENLLISAAAGSGKTAVLVERIIEKITDPDHPVDVDRLLVVTFTHAAANEMKERILKALEKMIGEKPASEHLLRQLSLVHKAQITTIDSFCLDLVKDYFYKIDIDPGFSIGDQEQMDLLKEEVLQDLLEDKYQQHQENFIKFVECFAPGKNDKGMESFVFDFYEKSRSHVNPHRFLKESSECYKIKTKQELNEAFWIKGIMEEAHERLAGAMDLTASAKEAAMEAGGPYYYRKTFESYEEQLSLMTDALDFESLGNALLQFKKPGLTGRKKKTDQIDEHLVKKCKDLRDQAQAQIDLIQKGYFYGDMDEMVRQIRVMSPVMEGFCDLVLEFSERFLERKKQENLFDFSDIEHFALKILLTEDDAGGEMIPSDVAQEKAHYYEEIYIDEYQDSNLIQDAMLQSVSGASFGVSNLFMVGDVKQSIYSFRLARPDLFLKRYKDYSGENATGRLIGLSSNFRSRSAILYFVNDIFGQIMKECLGKIKYDKEAQLVPGGVFKEDDTETVRTQMLLVSNTGQEKMSMDKLSAQSLVMTRKIKELTGSGDYQYRDIVILLRSVKGKAETIREILMNEGIPAFCASKSGYFDTPEIRTVLSLLAVVDNVYQDIEMTAYLRSPMVDMKSEELAALRLCNSEGSMYDCLCTSAKEGNEKAAKAQNVLHILRREKSRRSLQELIWLALDQTGYYVFAGALPQGDRRQANLLMLIERAKSYEKTRYQGLFHFLRYMDLCREYQMDFGEASTIGENENIVRIMSIHQSKGLEFPVVFLADTDKKFNLQDSRQSLIFHSDFGIGADFIDPGKRTKRPMILKEMIKNQMRNDALGEELRVLYVALTRAKEQLYLTGVAREKHQVIQQKREIHYVDLISAGSYLDWIFLALQRTGTDHVSVQYTDSQDLTLEQTFFTMVNGEEKSSFIQKLSKQTEGAEELIRDFEYRYPYEEESGGRLKYSVTEIKQMSQTIEEHKPDIQRMDQKKQPVIPSFLAKKKEPSPTQRGTAVHKALELLDFKKAYSKDDVETQLRQWILEGKLPAESANTVRPEDLLGFLHSSLGQRASVAAGAGMEYKEAQFVMGVPFSKMHPGADGGSYVVVQGIIDLYFEEDGELVIVDYKTDRIKEGEEAVLADHYHAQLDYYKNALEQMTGKTVKECWLYSVTLGKAVLINERTV